MTFSINPPDYVSEALERLYNAQKEAYVVGGCIRDNLLGKTPHDWDITTNATPDEISAIFCNYPIITTGEKHGTISPIINHNVVDITTFRHDGTYSDYRHPDDVVFSHHLKDDLSRRDFTINAMAWSEQTGLVDYFNGYQDLQLKQIKTVGNPTQRFQEDALRIMRCVRFSSSLEFIPTAETLLAANSLSPLLQHIAVERIQAELNQILCTTSVAFYLNLFQPILFEIIPELKPLDGFEQYTKYHQFDVWQHTLQTIQAAPNDLILRLAMLLHDIGKPLTFTRSPDGVGHFKGHEQVSQELAQIILKRLRYSKQVVSQVTRLIEFHSITIAPTKKNVKKWIVHLGNSTFYQLLLVMQADASGKSIQYKQIQLEEIQIIKEIADEILSEGSCLSLKQLQIDGKDLLNLGIPQGVQIGMLLDSLLQKVLDGTLNNSRKDLIQEVENIKKGSSFLQ